MDWQLTERYADAARAKHYAATRGEDDFNLLSNEVARALNEVALTNGPGQAAWRSPTTRVSSSRNGPPRTYGYRAADVAQLSALLDEVVSELRVAAGQSRFDLKLIAAGDRAAGDGRVPGPEPARKHRAGVHRGPRCRRTGRARVASRVDRADARFGDARRRRAGRDFGHRRQLGRDGQGARRPPSLRRSRRSIVRTPRSHRARWHAASDRARRADVRALDTLARNVLTADAKLGRARPNEVTALLVAIDAQKAAAQRLRLARDAWTLRAVALFATYRRQAGGTARSTETAASAGSKTSGSSPGRRRRRSHSSRSGRPCAGRELSLVKPPQRAGGGAPTAGGRVRSCDPCGVDAAQGHHGLATCPPRGKRRRPRPAR